MADLNLDPTEQEKIRKHLRKKMLNAFLIFTGVVIVGLSVFFIAGGGGNLFKGFIGEEPEVADIPKLELPSFPPTVISLTPAEGATDVPIAAGSVLVTFDEENLTYMTLGITFTKQGDTTNLITVESIIYELGTKTLQIPYPQLEQATTYTITIPSYSIINDGQTLEEDLIWSFATVGAAAPPPPPSCTENALQNNNTEICKEESWILCTSFYEGTKSTDGTKECKSGTWQAVATTAPPPGDGDGGDLTCTENSTKDSKERICKGSLWIKCTSTREGDKSTDGKKECKDGEWTDISAAPPGTGAEISITDHDVFPEGFNPLINETKISYELSAKAKIEIKIINNTGVTVVTLIDDKVVEAGEYYVWWNGTDKKDTQGTVVQPGTYTYKITAKDPDTSETADTKSGSMTAFYTTVGTDFEDFGTGTGTTTTTTTDISQNAAATVVMQDTETGVTSGTGTPVIIYILFPLAGYLLTRKKLNI